MFRERFVLLVALAGCTRPTTTTPTATPTPTPAMAPPAAAARIEPAKQGDEAGTSCEPEGVGSKPLRRDRVSFEHEGKYGFRDATGKVVIAAAYVVVTEFTAEGTCGVIREDGTAWFIDLEGRPVARAKFFDNGPDYFVQGRARVVDHDKVGFIDRAGKLVVPTKFDAAGSFCDGLAPVCMGCKEVREGEHTRLEGGQWGFVDRNGALVVPVMYDAVEGFTGGTAIVRKAGRRFAIDRDGREVPDAK